MSVESDLAALKLTIDGLPTRNHMVTLLDILYEYNQPAKDEAIALFLNDYPIAKKNIMEDLLSYPNYDSITEEP